MINMAIYQMVSLTWMPKISILPLIFGFIKMNIISEKSLSGLLSQEWSNFILLKKSCFKNTEFGKDENFFTSVMIMKIFSIPCFQKFERQRKYIEKFFIYFSDVNFTNSMNSVAYFLIISMWFMKRLSF